MKIAAAALPALLLAACAANGPVHEIHTQDVPIVHVERAITPRQVAEAAPPAPLGPRPATTPAALDAAMAKLCEYVGYAQRADPLLQHAAGLATISQRVNEPVCAGGAAPH